ncbi:MAG: MerR family transcriptional regulator [Dictyoglomus sp. NZ13-RE01]|nr:MAG: MerR family transcriptional regulator [Dictyoglomus sp. NZ13-RE01]
MTIKEVSEKYGISQDTLRYYEKIGLIPKVKRNKNGIREYSEDDCRWIEFIKCMRSAGIEIDALLKYVKLMQEGESTLEARKQILIEQRDKIIAQIEVMQRALEKLNNKIKNYDIMLSKFEKTLRK